MDLEGKTAVVTGAGRGIGKATALALAGQGAFVYCVSRTGIELEATATTIRKAGGKADFRTCDVANQDSVARGFSGIQSSGKMVDLLVNAAGIQGPIGPFSENDLAAWKRNVETNVFGAVHCIRCVLPGMVERGRGSIVNFSGGGAVSPRERFSAYAASKTAVVRFTETLALELKGTGVRVNTVAPGAVNTAMLDEVLAAGEKAGRDFRDAVRRMETGGTDPSVAAELVCFLASDASADITGKLISAVWDPWRDPAFQERLKKDPDFAALRRVDGKNFDRIG